MVVIQGMHPSVIDDELTSELGFACRRIVSSQHEGAATWKVKAQCTSAEEKAGILRRGGIVIWHQRFRVVDYIGQPKVTRCYKCQGYNHIAASCENARKCSNCSGSHETKECNTAEKQCANCDGGHASSSFECPKLVSEIAKKETSSLSYANAVKRGGDKIDCTRLACSIATAVRKILVERLKLEVSTAHISEDVAASVSLHYKVDIRPLHVMSMAFATAEESRLDVHHE
jgi:hypothetical protein